MKNEYYEESDYPDCEPIKNKNNKNNNKSWSKKPHKKVKPREKDRAKKYMH